MSEIRIIAEMRLLPGAKNELEEAFKKLVAESRAEKGNISYELTECLTDPDLLFVIEIWASEEAIEAHNQTQHFKEFMQVIAGKTTENRVIKLKKIL